jgi:hypothetical protein
VPASRRFVPRLAAAIAAVLLPAAPAAADPNSPTLIVWSKTSDNKPYYATWGGSSWGAGAAMPNINGDGHWFVVRNCPTRNETACLSLDNQEDVNIQFFNGTSWGTVTELCTDAGTSDRRPVDLAYEQQSGDALVVYWDEAESNIGYRTYNGVSLSSEADLALTGMDETEYLALYPRPGGDEIILLACGDEELRANVWTGSGWSGWTTLESDLESEDRESFGLAFETLSRDAVVVYPEDDENQPRYRTWNGSSWSGELTLPSIGAQALWIRLAADPASDAILFASLDDQKDINVNHWNGSAWGSNLEVENSGEFQDRRQFDLAFEPQGTEALLVYHESGATNLHYRTWNGSAWSGEADGSGIGHRARTIQLRTGTASGEIFIACSDEGNDLEALRWDGTSMSATTQIHGNLNGTATVEQFMLCVPAAAALVPANIPYAHDFETTMGSEWSNGTVTSNATFTTFAGRHRTTPLKLALYTTAGETYSIVFDLYAIDSWDGDDPGGGKGPDSFIVSANGGQIFSHTLVHESPAQGMTYPCPYDQMGQYGFNSSWKDAIYRRVEAVFTATESVTTLAFTAQLTDEAGQGFNDESWGLDNISVKAARFIDVSTARGFNVQNSSSADTYGGGLHWADLDADGDLDAILTGDTAKYLRSGSAGAGFTAATFPWSQHRRQAALLDIDNDGDIDLWTPALTNPDDESCATNDGAGAFSHPGNLGFSSATGNEACAAADVNKDGCCDLAMFSANANWLVRHQGGPSPVLSGSNSAADGLNTAGDYGDGDYCSAGDVNNDNYPDFFYHYGGGRLFLSDGDGTYTRNNHGIAITTGASLKTGSAWADYDNDGDLDLFAGRASEACTGFLWRNDRDWTAGTGAFTDVTASAGLNLNTVIDYTPDLPGGRSAAWGDYDNDGDVDLLIVTPGAAYLYQNVGGGSFQRTGEGAAVSGTLIDGTFVDVDNDGDLDLAFTREGGTSLLLENRTNGTASLAVRVVGRGGGGTNRPGVGTRVELWNAAGTTRLGRRDLGTARGYGGSQPLWAHFGGTSAGSSYKVKVYFHSKSASDPQVVDVVPSAATTIIGSTTIARMLTVTEPSKVKVIQWSEVRNKP